MPARCQHGYDFSFASWVLGATVTECDLVVHGYISEIARGLLYDPGVNRYE